MKNLHTNMGMIIIGVIPVLVLQLLYSETFRSMNSRDVPFLFDYAVFKPRYSDEYPTDMQCQLGVSGQSQSVVDLFVYILKNRLIYIRHGDGFVTKFMVEATLSDKAGTIILSKSHTDSIVTYSYKSTLSDGSPYIIMFEFIVPYGEYKVDLKLHDMELRKSKFWQTDIQISHFENGELQLSDIVLRYPFISRYNNGSMRNSWRRFIPNPTKQYGSFFNIDNVSLYFEVYGLQMDRSRPLQLEISVLAIKSTTGHENEYNQVISSFRRSINEMKNDLSIIMDFSTENLPPGKYFITITAGQSEISRESKRSAIFTVHQSPVSLKFKTFSDAMDEIRYLITQKEKKQLKNIPPWMQQKALLDFWKVRDPTPGTPENELMMEYYKRLEIADNSFKEGRLPGWKTDRGRIYVLYGKPDEINFENVIINRNWRQISYNIIIWRYHSINKNFVFVDMLGFGDYRLANQNGNDFIPLMY